MLIDVECQTLRAMVQKHGLLALIDELTEDESLLSTDLQKCADLLEDRTLEAEDREEDQDLPPISDEMYNEDRESEFSDEEDE